MARKVYYLKLAIEGIQKYICSTGKLKEMIGGSEIIAHLASTDFYEPILKNLGLEEDKAAQGSPGKYIVAQANAGALCLIVPDQEKAREFLGRASYELLKKYPGLPFYGGIREVAWSDDQTGRKAYTEARRFVENEIKAQRNDAPVPCGSGLLPILKASRLDGLPAVEDNRGERISLPSLARRNQEMIDKSRKRLRENVKSSLELVWPEDLEEMLGDDGGKVALICMDGNDLGKLFGDKLEEASKLPLCESIRQMKELSRKVENCNKTAFIHACELISEYEASRRKHKDSKLLMPLRPLVMGGDDITIITRADIALAFVSLFTTKYDEIGAKDKFSIGIGMVVMDSSYPFAKAFPLAESLQDSAKNLTRNKKPGERPSSLDYIVLTEDVENNIDAVRQRLFTAPGGVKLTSKPFSLEKGKFIEFMDIGRKMLAPTLPHSQLRKAWTLCRKGPTYTKEIWLNLKENYSRAIGSARLDIAQLFPEGFFTEKIEENGEKVTFTSLGDYLELKRLLPCDQADREAQWQIIQGKMPEARKAKEKGDV